MFNFSFIIFHIYPLLFYFYCNLYFTISYLKSQMKKRVALFSNSL
uniref:Uncharacterized protein n=1 Tax=Siphoviridae sp. ctHip2 TaxID=2827830 RepID=A0A8S5RVJ2_9CAUD|nr:MAG TPA: hypothetical protein [Siphoviridae sp. ctHip2]